VNYYLEEKELPIQLPQAARACRWGLFSSVL